MDRPAIFFYFFLRLFLVCQSVPAQQLVFNRADFNEQLPSSESYHVFQDGQEYLWIATEMGLCRWNGRNMRVYDGRNGLAEKAIYAVRQQGGKTWMVSSKNRIITLDGGRLRVHQITGKFRQSLGPLEEFTYRIDFDKEMVLNTKWASYVLDTISGNVRKIPVRAGTSRLDIVDNRPVILNSIMPSPVERIDLNFNGKAARQLSIPFRGEWTYRYMDCVASGRSFFAYNDQLIELLPQGGARSFAMAGTISSLFADGQGGLWVGMYKKGLRYFKGADIQTGIAGLQGLSVSSMSQDREGNIWCTTLERGVFVCANKQLVDHGNDFGGSSEQMFLGQLGGGILLANKDRVAVFGLAGKLLEKPVRELLPPELSTSPAMELLASGKVRDLKEAGNDGLLGIGYAFIYNFKGRELRSIPIDHPGYCLLPQGKGSLLFGSNDGLYQFWLSRGRAKKIAPTTSRVTSLLAVDGGGILIGTKGDGAFMYKDGKLQRFAKVTGIVYDMVRDNRGNIWLATSRGLTRAAADGKLSMLDARHGLFPGAVLKVAAMNGHLLFATSMGIFMFPLDTGLGKLRPVTMRLGSVSAGGRGIRLDSGYRLPYYRNSLRFKFEMLSFGPERPRLRYRISGDTSHYISSSGDIFLQNQQPGTYRLEVDAVNGDGLAGRAMVFDYVIAAPIWERWWFICLCALFLGLVTFVLTRYLSKRSHHRIQEANRIDRLIAESKLEALQAQMNPHFVFNCINSIQNYIVKRDVALACEYLSRFSRLIRAVLEHSNRQTVSVGQEMAVLELYISLERQRFDREFTYEKLISPEVDIERLLIPAMLVQPFVENAIWHGLMPLEDRPGKLTLCVFLNGTRLCIEIRDNGIGREKAREFIRKGEGGSYGVKLNQQRIGNLNQIYGSTEFKIRIMDNYEGQQASGTTVAIDIPVMYG